MDGLACRTVEPELMDELPAADERARRARRDLRRINSWMGNARELARRLRELPVGSQPLRLADLGSGDGTLLLAVARRLAGGRRRVQATLVDRQSLLTPQTTGEFSRLGWDVTPVEADVFDWAKSPGTFDVVSANLFLHHFQSEPLGRLLAGVAAKCRLFVACEPPRCRAALAAVHLLPLIGCGAVVRYDAVVSVRAGFADHELSTLWPADPQWDMREGRAGTFTHSFRAWRR